MRTLSHKPPCLPRYFATASIDKRQGNMHWNLSAHIEIRQELWSLSGDDSQPPTTMYAAYSVPGNSYIGDIDFAKYLVGKCIQPELIDPSKDVHVCQVGWSAPLKKWFGWSHRAMVGFGIGDRVFEAGYGDDSTPFTHHGTVVIENYEQARQAACAFADYVS